MGKLVLLRHGQSLWNKKNIFTGWVDIPLTREGMEEARDAGQELADLDFDAIYISTLIRAEMTAIIAMLESRSGKIPCLVDKDFLSLPEAVREQMIPMYVAKELNERHYGKLQGCNKDQIKAQFGEEQFRIWRRSYAGQPPDGESLKMTIERALPFFEEKIIPHMKEGKTILITAHGNSLRGIIKYLRNLSEEEIVGLEIPTGKPIYFTYTGGAFHL